MNYIILKPHEKCGNRLILRLQKKVEISDFSSTLKEE